jgi:hypothetical protein
MKQIIVMVATIALGIAIAGFVMSFKSSADSLAGAANDKIKFDIVTAAPAGG